MCRWRWTLCLCKTITKQSSSLPSHTLTWFADEQGTDESRVHISDCVHLGRVGVGEALGVAGRGAVFGADVPHVLIISPRKDGVILLLLARCGVIVPGSWKQETSWVLIQQRRWVEAGKLASREWMQVSLIYLWERCDHCNSQFPYSNVKSKDGACCKLYRLQNPWGTVSCDFRLPTFFSIKLKDFSRSLESPIHSNSRT